MKYRQTSCMTILLCTSVHSLKAEVDHLSLFVYFLLNLNCLGVAVLSVVLLDDSGQYQPFSPGVVTPTIVTDWSSASFKDMMDQVTSSTEKPVGPSLCVYIWEKGNVAFAELRSLLTKCFNHSVIDSLLELFLLPSPIAAILEEEEDDDEEDELDDTSMLEEPFDETPTPLSSISSTTPVLQQQTSQPVRSRHDTFSIMKAVEDAMSTPPDYNIAVEGQIAGLQVKHLKVHKYYCMLCLGDAIQG